MISDTLFEAVEAIREYQRSMPHVYDDLCKHIDCVVGEMEALRVVLDTPPPRGG